MGGGAGRHDGWGQGEGGVAPHTAGRAQPAAPLRARAARRRGPPPAPAARARVVCSVYESRRHGLGAAAAVRRCPPLSAAASGASGHPAPAAISTAHPKQWASVAGGLPLTPATPNRPRVTTARRLERRQPACGGNASRRAPQCFSPLPPRAVSVGGGGAAGFRPAPTGSGPHPHPPPRTREQQRPPRAAHRPRT